MNFSLAGGHEKRQKSPATAMPEADFLTLIDVPQIAELERQVRSGKSWSKDFEASVDAVSIALFGVTKADTVPAAPLADAFYQGRDFDEAAFSAACSTYDELAFELTPPPADETPWDILTEWWLDADIDVEDQDGKPLRCLSFIERQSNAAAFELLPAARLTLDGSGKRGSVSAETWGASLAAEAARFTVGR